MTSYRYRGIFVHLCRPQRDGRTWKSSASIAGAIGGGPIDEQIRFEVSATSERQAFVLSAQHCNKWIDARISDAGARALARK